MRRTPAYCKKDSVTITLGPEIAGMQNGPEKKPPAVATVRAFGKSGDVVPAFLVVAQTPLHCCKLLSDQFSILFGRASRRHRSPKFRRLPSAKVAGSVACLS